MTFEIKGQETTVIVPEAVPREPASVGLILDDETVIQGPPIMTRRYGGEYLTETWTMRGGIVTGMIALDSAGRELGLGRDRGHYLDMTDWCSLQLTCHEERDIGWVFSFDLKRLVAPSAAPAPAPAPAEQSPWQPATIQLRDDEGQWYDDPSILEPSADGLVTADYVPQSRIVVTAIRICNGHGLVIGEVTGRWLCQVTRSYQWMLSTDKCGVWSALLLTGGSAK